MPLINGMKMACEPCIRGHRSTKCTHANERLMVPVRKPGRPLSQCPHPGGQACMCGSVTAAIPRKQTCGCGGYDPPTHTPGAVVVAAAAPKNPQAASQEIPDTISPTKPNFKVQKNSRSPSGGRKLSFDPMNFERIDLTSVNILPFKQQPPSIPMAATSPDGYVMAASTQAYDFTAQYSQTLVQFNAIPMQTSPNHFMAQPSITGIDGSSNGIMHQKGLYPISNSMATPIMYTNANSHNVSRRMSDTTPHSLKQINNNDTNDDGLKNATNSLSSNSSSCCAPVRKAHSRTSSISSTIAEEPEEAEPRSCCSSKPKPLKQENTPQNGGLESAALLSLSQVPAQNGVPFSPAMYQSYLPHNPTVFTYPPTYGSFQNPLQPSAWLESTRSSNRFQQYPAMSTPQGNLYNGQIVSADADTVHTCGCGDTCQCIGCAAHPYNDATQNYVRSAYTSMSGDQAGGEIYTNGHVPPTPTNTNGTVQPQNVDSVSSPISQTPSSAASINEEEQSLEASDFFFVNYSLSTESCGGDMMDCPCGEDCQCLGCTVHGN